ncbi:MAG TPA: hypothetical protein DIC50_02525 [Verrucomicrobia subdivision 3 bacterium]|nr:hypothetical protein [Limisphaerales bacterium]
MLRNLNQSRAGDKQKPLAGGCSVLPGGRAPRILQARAQLQGVTPGLIPRTGQLSYLSPPPLVFNPHKHHQLSRGIQNRKSKLTQSPREV